VKLHPTSVERSTNFIQKHIGTSLLFPPESLDRLQELGPMEDLYFDVINSTPLFSLLPHSLPLVDQW
jgi:hypothetical protein